MGLSSGPCLFLASFGRSSRGDASSRILNVGLVKLESCLRIRELRLFQADFKVLCKEVITVAIFSRGGVAER